jgi:hypothetical protein
MYSSAAEKRSNELLPSFLMCGCRTNLIFLSCTCLVSKQKDKKKKWEFSYNMELMMCSVFAGFVNSQTTNKLLQKLNYKWKDNSGITD